MAGRTPPAWQRQGAGRYRSADGRFELEQGDPGRWFLIDTAELDELGLARTLGPYATLAAARSDAERRRAEPAEASPLEERIEAARRRESQAPASVGPGSEGAAGPAKGGRTPGRGEPPATRGAGASESVAAPPRSWLDDLEPRAASRARRLIGRLTRLGVADPEQLVRVDTQTEIPAVARALLARSIRAAALQEWTAERVLKHADRAARERLEGVLEGLDDDALTMLASWIAREAVAAALDQASRLERDPEAPGMPGWRLVEHDPQQPERERRIVLGWDDLAPTDD